MHLTFMTLCFVSFSLQEKKKRKTLVLSASEHVSLYTSIILALFVFFVTNAPLKGCTGQELWCEVKYTSENQWVVVYFCG